jgi:hypothetical protein
MSVLQNAASKGLQVKIGYLSTKTEKVGDKYEPVLDDNGVEVREVVERTIKISYMFKTSDGLVRIVAHDNVHPKSLVRQFRSDRIVSARLIPVKQNVPAAVDGKTVVVHPTVWGLLWGKGKDRPIEPQRINIESLDKYMAKGWSVNPCGIVLEKVLA